MTDIKGKSFVGRLVCETELGENWVDYLRSQDVAGSGWLVQGADEEHVGTPLLLRFDFIEEVGDRLHYHISVADESPGDYSGARVGVSMNGYVGLYKIASVTDYWKIELLPNDPSDDHPVFFLRDVRGYRIAANYERKGHFYNSIDPDANDIVGYLNVEKGYIARFRVQVKRYL